MKTELPPLAPPPLHGMLRCHKACVLALSRLVWLLGADALTALEASLAAGNPFNATVSAPPNLSTYRLQASLGAVGVHTHSSAPIQDAEAAVFQPSTLRQGLFQQYTAVTLPVESLARFSTCALLPELTKRAEASPPPPRRSLAAAVTPSVVHVQNAWGFDQGKHMFFTLRLPLPLEQRVKN